MSDEDAGVPTGVAEVMEVPAQSDSILGIQLAGMEWRERMHSRALDGFNLFLGIA